MAWFKWGKGKDDCGDGDKDDRKPDDEPKPYTTEKAAQHAWMIMYAGEYDRRMDALRDFVTTLPNLFPVVPGETPEQKTLRQNAMISSAIYEYLEQNGTRSLINEEPDIMFLAIDRQLSRMNDNPSSKRWVTHSITVSRPRGGDKTL